MAVSSCFCREVVVVVNKGTQGALTLWRGRGLYRIIDLTNLMVFLFSQDEGLVENDLEGEEQEKLLLTQQLYELREQRLVLFNIRGFVNLHGMSSSGLVWSCRTVKGVKQYGKHYRKAIFLSHFFKLPGWVPCDTFAVGLTSLFFSSSQSFFSRQTDQFRTWRAQGRGQRRRPS